MFAATMLALVAARGGCPTCQAVCVKDLTTSDHVSGSAAAGGSHVTWDLFALADGKCGPSPSGGSACSDPIRTEGCDFLVIAEAFSGPDEFIVVVAGGAGPVILPPGAWQGQIPVDDQKCGSYQSVDCYVYDLGSLAQLDSDFTRRWCRWGCVDD